MAKKKSPTPNWGVIVILLVGVLLVLNSQGLLAVGGGQYLVLSLDEIDYINSDPKLGGPAWSAEIVLTPKGEQLTGKTASSFFSTSDISGANKGDEEPEVGFGVSADITNSKCEFPYQLDTKLYQSRIWEIGIEAGWEDKLEKQCEAANGVSFWAGTGFLQKKVWCWTWQQRAKVGTIGAGTFNWEADFKFTSSNGRTLEGTLSNTQSTDSVGSLAHLAWAGSLSTGTACDLDYWIARDDIKNTFNMIPSTAALKIVTLPDKEVIRACVNYNRARDYEGYMVVECDDTFNNVVTSILQPVSVPGYEGVVNGKVTVDTKPIQSPVVRLRVDADWMGVKVFQGKPEIVSAESIGFVDGKYGKIIVKVKNVAKDDGSFEVTASCSSGFTVIDTDSGTVGAGDTETFVLGINGQCADKSRSGECTVKVVDSQGTNSDTEKVTVDCKAEAVCESGQQICDGKIIKTCNDDGRYTETKTCDDDCVEKNERASCEKDDDDDDGKAIKCLPYIQELDASAGKCVNQNDNLLLIFAGAVLLGGFYLVYQNKNKSGGRGGGGYADPLAGIGLSGL